jgi:large subunit ribosomal protein L29
MTIVKIETLRELTRVELEQRKGELSDEQFNLRMRTSLKKLDNPLRLRQIRREIAKIMTVLREDELEIRKLAKTGTATSKEESPKKKANKK